MAATMTPEAPEVTPHEVVAGAIAAAACQLELLERGSDDPSLSRALEHLDAAGALVGRRGAR